MSFCTEIQAGRANGHASWHSSTISRVPNPSGASTKPNGWNGKNAPICEAWTECLPRAVPPSKPHAGSPGSRFPQWSYPRGGIGLRGGCYLPSPAGGRFATAPPARFGQIAIVRGPDDGVGALDDTLIRRMLPFAEGTLYNRELLFEGQRNLYSLQILSHASILEDLANEPDSVVPLIVTVNEGNRHQVRAGGAWRK